ncbi:LxmA leader domain family RiPP [Agreia sp. COWG]|uniref:LxmA leader domain family RiPP n=1 Tax=Agreia sp. COWG TaxID=2773266 RepID=UPI0019296B2A|nr:LxmA leader domain family RiPP [Agreia sp. COWG]CAD5990935.1 conserved protein of unknown function [Agreia sp. COWG]
MNNAQTLIAGFTTYAGSAEITALGAEAAPGFSPVSVFLTASSPECVAFSIGASAGAVTSTSVTIGAGC